VIWRRLLGRFRAPLVGAWTSCGHAGSAEHVQDGPVGHAEVFADHRERLTGLVHFLSDRDVVITEDPIARLHADPTQEGEDGGAVDAELLCECARGFPGEVSVAELRSLGIGQSGLLLTDRWDGSMGRSVTPVTRENAV
jgi:hypothetical protein